MSNGLIRCFPFTLSAGSPFRAHSYTRRTSIDRCTFPSSRAQARPNLTSHAGFFFCRNSSKSRSDDNDSLTMSPRSKLERQRKTNDEGFWQLQQNQPRSTHPNDTIRRPPWVQEAFPGRSPFKAQMLGNEEIPLKHTPTHLPLARVALRPPIHTPTPRLHRHENSPLAMRMIPTHRLTTT